MIVRNRIWEELRQAKCNIICLQRYTDRVRKRSRFFNTFMIFCASIGAIGGVYKQYIAVVASFLIAVSSILKALLPNVIQSDQELSDLDRLMDFYSKYLNALEKIWYENENKLIEEKEIVEKLFALKDDECDKYSSMNKGVRRISPTEMKKINEQAQEYVSRVYFDYKNKTA